MNYLTFNVVVMLCVSGPVVPVMVSVLSPSGVVDEGHTVSVEDPAPVIDVGLKLTNASAGKVLVMLRATLSLKVFTNAEVETVKVVHDPAKTLMNVGFTDIANFGGGTKLNMKEP